MYEQPNNRLVFASSKITVSVTVYRWYCLGILLPDGSHLVVSYTRPEYSEIDPGPIPFDVVLLIFEFVPDIVPCDNLNCADAGLAKISAFVQTEKRWPIICSIRAGIVAHGCRCCRRNILTSMWMLSMVAIVSSRVDYSADVIRGSLFAFVVFFFYLHVAPLVSSPPSKKISPPVSIAANHVSDARPQENPLSGPSRIEIDRHRPPISIPVYDTNTEIRRLRNLYLALMRHTLTNTIYEDPPIAVFDSSSGTKFRTGESKFDLWQREAGLDLPSQAYCKATSSVSVSVLIFFDRPLRWHSLSLHSKVYRLDFVK